jgi:phosphoribosylamine-glycine ligase
VTLTIPPYPTEIRIPKAADVPISGINPEDIELMKQIYMYDVKLDKTKKGLITSGNYGFVCAPTGIGGNADEANANCEKLIKQIQIPNMQYRTDIHKSTQKRYQFLEENCWL